MKCVSSIDDFEKLLQKNCVYMKFSPSLYVYSNEIDEWCEENFTGQYYFGICELVAEHEEDLMIFKLRWT